MSSADGEALPPRVSRRYAARCFILADATRELDYGSKIILFKCEGCYTYAVGFGLVLRTRESISLSTRV